MGEGPPPVEIPDARRRLTAAGGEALLDRMSSSNTRGVNSARRGAKLVQVGSRSGRLRR